MGAMGGRAAELRRLEKAFRSLSLAVQTVQRGGSRLTARACCTFVDEAVSPRVSLFARVLSNTFFPLCNTAVC